MEQATKRVKVSPPGVAILNMFDVKRLMLEREPILAETVILHACNNPYEGPLIRIPLFPKCRELLLYQNDKYFNDKWLTPNQFPILETVWIDDMLPGGFFDYRRGSANTIYKTTEDTARYRRFPPQQTVFVTHAEMEQELLQLGWVQEPYCNKCWDYYCSHFYHDRRQAV